MFISEEYIKNFFHYEYWLSRNLWNDKVHEAMKTFGVFFDLENNDTNKEQRNITIPQDRWEHSKCKFRCEMWVAGGDWEYPVHYFRCQLADGYAYELRQYGDPFFIFIPNKEEGNSHLVEIDKGKNKGDFRAPHDGEKEYDPKVDKNPSKRKCWESLNKYLKKLVDMEIEKNKKGKE